MARIPSTHPTHTNADTNLTPLHHPAACPPQAPTHTHAASPCLPRPAPLHPPTRVNLWTRLSRRLCSHTGLTAATLAAPYTSRNSCSTSIWDGGVAGGTALGGPLRYSTIHQPPAGSWLLSDGRRMWCTLCCWGQGLGRAGKGWGLANAQHALGCRRPCLPAQPHNHTSGCCIMCKQLHLPPTSSRPQEAGSANAHVQIPKDKAERVRAGRGGRAPPTSAPPCASLQWQAVVCCACNDDGATRPPTTTLALATRHAARHAPAA